MKLARVMGEACPEHLKIDLETNNAESGLDDDKIRLQNYQRYQGIKILEKSVAEEKSHGK